MSQLHSTNDRPKIPSDAVLAPEIHDWLVSWLRDWRDEVALPAAAEIVMLLNYRDPAYFLPAPSLSDHEIATWRECIKLSGFVRLKSGEFSAILDELEARRTHRQPGRPADTYCQYIAAALRALAVFVITGDSDRLNENLAAVLNYEGQEEEFTMTLSMLKILSYGIGQHIRFLIDAKASHNGLQGPQGRTS